jgi:hypothetical protein
MIGEDLKPYRRAADIIEAARLDSTIVRPAWLTDCDEVDYETTTETGLLSAMSAVDVPLLGWDQSAIQDWNLLTA